MSLSTRPDAALSAHGLVKRYNGGVTAVDVVGIATDHCVRATALDAAREGFGVRVLLPLTAAVAPETAARALAEMRAAGVELSGEPAT